MATERKPRKPRDKFMEARAAAAKLAKLRALEHAELIETPLEITERYAQKRVKVLLDVGDEARQVLLGSGDTSEAELEKVERARASEANGASSDESAETNGGLSNVETDLGDVAEA